MGFIKDAVYEVIEAGEKLSLSYSYGDIYIYIYIYICTIFVWAIATRPLWWYICDYLSKNPPNPHLPVFRENYFKNSI